MADLNRARDFMATSARTIDRRRLEVLLDGADPQPVLDALGAFRNADGGFGWGLEPDQRSPTSQPAGALHVLEVCAETGDRGPLAVSACDWLATVSNADGGVPFSVGDAGGAGVSPVWAAADTRTSSLHLTTALCAAAHRAGVEHPWLDAASAYCQREIAALREPPFAYTLKYVLWFLDAAGDAAELERVGAFLPRSGAAPVIGGAEGETMHAVDYAPHPGPLAALIDPDALAADLDRLSAAQEADGGWRQDWVAETPAAALEWRGWVTVRALAALRAHGRI
jgi:hypothetical protein